MHGAVAPNHPLLLLQFGPSVAAYKAARAARSASAEAADGAAVAADKPKKKEKKKGDVLDRAPRQEIELESQGVEQVPV